MSGHALAILRNGGAATADRSRDDRYKWVALSNVTLGVLMATIDGSITLIAMPDIFRGIHLDPLQAGNSFYLLWMLLGFLVVTSVLVVNFGRLGDLFGRVRLYNLGFVVYTLFSLLLTVTWQTGRAGALYLVIMRIFQGVGSALLIANSAAILTDAFPEQPAGDGPRHQQHRRHQRPVHRAGVGRPARADRLAARLPHLGPDRAVRHRLGVPEAGGPGGPSPGADRLARATSHSRSVSSG